MIGSLLKWKDTSFNVNSGVFFLEGEQKVPCCFAKAAAIFGKPVDRLVLNLGILSMRVQNVLML